MPHKQSQNAGVSKTHDISIFETESDLRIGYARVSTRDQNSELQTNTLNDAGCERIFEESASGAQKSRPQLKEALSFLRESDTMVFGSSIISLGPFANSLKPSKQFMSWSKLSII